MMNSHKALEVILNIELFEKRRLHAVNATPDQIPVASHNCKFEFK